MRRVHIPTELPVCIPPFVVGWGGEWVVGEGRQVEILIIMK